MKLLPLFLLPVLLVACSENKKQTPGQTASKGNVPLPMGVTIKVQELPDSISDEEANKLLPKGDTEWVNYNGQQVMTIRTSSCQKPRK